MNVRVSWACTACHTGWEITYELIVEEVPALVTCERCGRTTHVVRRGMYVVEDL